MDEVERWLTQQVPILRQEEMCACPPEFVMLYKVAFENRWVLVRRLSGTTPVPEEMTTQDALEYMAGNYSHWTIACQHCGLTYAEGRA